jgi:hypothetical protein
MTNLIDPESLRTRTLRQVFEDGVEEIYIGLFALAMGGFYLACFAIKTSTSSMSMLSIGESVWLAVVMLLVAARKKVKQTFVVPRTGHVVYCHGRNKRWMIAACGLAAVGLAAGLAIWNSHVPDLRPVAGLITGLISGAGFLWAGVTYRFPHLNWIGVLSLLLGIVTYLANASTVGMVWVLFGVGLAMAISGAVRFRTFLKTHPIVTEAR